MAVQNNHVWKKMLNLLLLFVFCLFSQSKKAEETSSQPVPVPQGKKHLSGSYLDGSESQDSSLHQINEPKTPQKRPADGADTLEVC